MSFIMAVSTLKKLIETHLEISRGANNVMKAADKYNKKQTINTHQGSDDNTLLSKNVDVEYYLNEYSNMNLLFPGREAT